MCLLNKLNRINPTFLINPTSAKSRVDHLQQCVCVKEGERERERERERKGDRENVRERYVQVLCVLLCVCVCICECT